MKREGKGCDVIRMERGKGTGKVERIPEIEKVKFRINTVSLGCA